MPHAEAQERAVEPGRPPRATPATATPILEHCRACARALVAALQDLKFAKPEEIQGLL